MNCSPFIEFQIKNNLELPESQYRDRAIALSLWDARLYFSDYKPFVNWLKKSGFSITPEKAKTLILKYYE